MSQKANPTAIGLFVVTAMLLAAAALILISSGSLFSRKAFLILYFEDNVNGLNEGSLVKYKGVKIGQVSKIHLKYNQAREDNHIPVIVQLEADLIQTGDQNQIDFHDSSSLQTMIDQGLRAKLEIESFVTGMLYIDIDRRSDAKKPVFHQLTPVYPEIPTVPSTMTKVKNAIADIDIVDMVQKLNKLLTSTESAISGLDTKEINKELLALMESVRTRIDSEDVVKTLAATRTTMENISKVTENLNQKIDPTLDELKSFSIQINETLSQVRTTLSQMNDILSPDSAIMVHLEDSLKRFGLAARYISELADILTRNPNAVITGKPAPSLRP